MSSKQVPEDPVALCKRELDDMLPKVTSEEVGRAMQGFPLPLADGWDMERLALAVRRVLACAPRPERRLTNGHRGSPYVIERASLNAMAKKAADTAQLFKGIEWSTRGRIMSLGLLSGNIGNQKPDPVPAMQRYDNVVRELEWLTSFLGEVASSISKPAPKWQAAVDREWRIFAGWGLAAVYAAAFASGPTAHKSESGETPFMEFFQRMMALAFGLGGGGPDFKAVTIEACERHRDEPAGCGWLLNP